MKKPLLTFLLSVASAVPAFAYDFSGCQVIEIVIAGENNAHVQLDCAVTNAPACAVANRYLGFDKSTTGGKHYLTMLTLAHAMGGKIEGSVDHAVCSPFQGNVPLLNGLRTKLPE